MKSILPLSPTSVLALPVHVYILLSTWFAMRLGSTVAVNQKSDNEGDGDGDKEDKVEESARFFCSATCSCILMTCGARITLGLTARNRLSNGVKAATDEDVFDDSSKA